MRSRALPDCLNRVFGLLCVAACMASPSACAAARPAADDAWRSIWKDAPVKPQHVATIQPIADPRPLPRAEAPSPKAGVAGGDLTGASRLPSDAPRGSMRVAVEAALPDGLDAEAIVSSGGAILVYGPARWALYSLDGTRRAAGVKAAGMCAIDAEGDIFYAPQPSGNLSAIGLADGKKRFDVALTYGAAYERRIIKVEGGVLRAVSVEKTTDPHAGIEPRDFLLEVRKLTDQRGGGLAADELVTQIVADLAGIAAHFACAMRGDELTFAADGRIGLVDGGGVLTTALTAAFEPRWLSLDEAGRIYLLAAVDRTLALWLIEPDGGRRYVAVLPADVGEPVAAPIVSLDHRAFVLTRTHVIAVDAQGRELWRHIAAGRVAGAGVTADDQLLLAAGNELGVIDQKGTHRQLHDFSPRSVTTPPIQTARGEVLVATTDRLYVLTAGPAD